MRKIVVSLVLVAAFAAGIVAGFGTREAQAGTRCWTECSGGEALYCCRTNGKLICKVGVGGC